MLAGQQLDGKRDVGVVDPVGGRDVQVVLGRLAERPDVGYSDHTWRTADTVVVISYMSLSCESRTAIGGAVSRDSDSMYVPDTDGLTDRN